MSVGNTDRRMVLAGLGAAAAAAMIPTPAVARAPLFKRMAKPIGLQLYALGDMPMQDMDGTLAKLAAIGFRDIELPHFYGRKPADLRAAADRAGVRISALHLNMPAPYLGDVLTLMSPAQQIADALNALGAYQVYLPLCPLPEGFSVPEGKTPQQAIGDAVLAAGADHWKHTADVLNTRAAALRPFGIALGYHNHNMEFAPLAGRATGWDILLAQTDPALVNFEFDLGWAAAAGRDLPAELARLKGRVKAVHIKDIKASTKTNFALDQDPIEVGAGALNWANILPAAFAAGVAHFYVEQEPPFTIDRLEAVTRGYRFLSRFAG